MRMSEHRDMATFRVGEPGDVPGQARAAPPVSDRALDLVLFRVGGESCALPMGSVRAIVHMAALACPPGLPSLLQGFLDLGGAAVPVLRTARLYGLPEREPGLYTPLIILHGQSCPLALLVDEVSGTLSVAADKLLPVADAQALNGCIEAEVATADHCTHLLSPERLLLQEERQRLLELQSMAQRRLQELDRNGDG